MTTTRWLFGDQVGAAFAELGRPVAHGGQDQVGLLPVEHPAAEHALGLDQQDGLAGVVQEVRSQLVSEEPPACHAVMLPYRRR